MLLVICHILYGFFILTLTCFQCGKKDPPKLKGGNNATTATSEGTEGSVSPNGAPTPKLRPPKRGKSTESVVRQNKQLMQVVEREAQAAKALEEKDKLRKSKNNADAKAARLPSEYQAILDRETNAAIAMQEKAQLKAEVRKKSTAAAQKGTMTAIPRQVKTQGPSPITERKKLTDTPSPDSNETKDPRKIATPDGKKPVEARKKKSAETLRKPPSTATGKSQPDVSTPEQKKNSPKSPDVRKSHGAMDEENFKSSPIPGVPRTPVTPEKMKKSEPANYGNTMYAMPLEMIKGPAKAAESVIKFNKKILQWPDDMVKVQKMSVTNEGTMKRAFKMRCSSVQAFYIHPVYGQLEPAETVEVEIRLVQPTTKNELIEAESVKIDENVDDAALVDAFKNGTDRQFRRISVTK